MMRMKGNKRKYEKGNRREQKEGKRIAKACQALKIREAQKIHTS